MFTNCSRKARSKPRPHPLLSAFQNFTHKIYSNLPYSRPPPTSFANRVRPRKRLVYHPSLRQLRTERTLKPRRPQVVRIAPLRFIKDLVDPATFEELDTEVKSAVNDLTYTGLQPSAEDAIFLKQLERLSVDRGFRKELLDARELIERAARDAPRLEKAREARATQAAATPNPPPAETRPFRDPIYKFNMPTNTEYLQAAAHAEADREKQERARRQRQQGLARRMNFLNRQAAEFKARETDRLARQRERAKRAEEAARQEALRQAREEAVRQEAIKQAEDARRRQHEEEMQQQILQQEQEAFMRQQERLRQQQAYEQQQDYERHRAFLRQEAAHAQAEQDRAKAEEDAREQAERDRVKEEEEAREQAKRNAQHQAAREREGQQRREEGLREAALKRNTPCPDTIRQEQAAFQQRKEIVRQRYAVGGDPQIDFTSCEPMDSFALYELKWEELKVSRGNLKHLGFQQLPWPVFGQVTSPANITYDAIHTFLFDPARPGMKNKTKRDRLRPEILRYHPDKFDTSILPMVHPDHVAAVTDAEDRVAKLLNQLMELPM